jgi:integrase
MKEPRRQEGQLYVTPAGAIRLKYWTTVIEAHVESRKRRDIFICQQNDKHSAVQKDGRWAFSKDVHLIKDQLMLGINQQQTAFHSTAVKVDSRSIAGFWLNIYQLWMENELRKSTRRSYYGIWKAHLKAHFGSMSFLDYTTPMASRYLTTLAERGLSATTISHIRALASGIFSHAIATGIVPKGGNPWDDAMSFKAYTQAPETEFYSIEEARGLIDALKAEHPDWAVLMGLCFYAACRPSEAVAVKWEDFRRDLTGQWFVHISRACVDGAVAGTKNESSTAAVPIAQQLGELISVWHKKAGGRREGWVFPGERSKRFKEKPMDLRNLCQRKIKHAVIAAGFNWYGLYAFRRGVATHATQQGSILDAQALLRHKNPDTTEQAYAKLTAGGRLRAVKFLEAGTGADVGAQRS